MPDTNIPNNLPIEGKNLLDNVVKAQADPAGENFQTTDSNPPKPTNPETEDIFSDVAEAPPVSAKPQGDIEKKAEEQNLDRPQELASLETPHQGFKKVLITILSLVVMAGLLVGGGYWVYTQFLRPAPLNPNLNINVNSNKLPATQTNQQVEEQVNAVPLDSDNDGLTDAREIELGTDPKNPDTDGDRLFDREEVEVYKTDPLNKDTDGDTFEDGAEVQAGYDPKGPGKLILIPAGE
ncbi:thrombospondin type 3 repeat-containing protein [Candidatus Parcubacteria bacterium]|nr:thrombospondin type 3 repeat-containing protein [Patescibacteria group bacterium]MCG2694254.1 thrombospondin type 3 repeat-containing protein [Candidatus Parcubacteria bacterium]